MKLKVLMAAVAIFISGAAFAQQDEVAQQEQKREAPTAEQIAQKKVEWMRKEYLLSKEQCEKIYKITLKKTEKQLKRWEQEKKDNEAFAEDMKGILNDAQWEHFEQQQKRHFAPKGRMHRTDRFNGKRAMRRHQHKECVATEQSPRGNDTTHSEESTSSPKIKGTPMSPIRDNGKPKPTNGPQM